MRRQKSQSWNRAKQDHLGDGSAGVLQETAEFCPPGATITDGMCETCRDCLDSAIRIFYEGSRKFTTGGQLRMETFYRVSHVLDVAHYSRSKDWCNIYCVLCLRLGIAARRSMLSWRGGAVKDEKAHMMILWLITGNSTDERTLRRRGLTIDFRVAETSEKTGAADSDGDSLNITLFIEQSQGDSTLPSVSQRPYGSPFFELPQGLSDCIPRIFPTFITLDMITLDIPRTHSTNWRKTDSVLASTKSKHRLCGSDVEVRWRWRPYRLLYISIDGAFVRLDIHEPRSELLSECPYLTLSHCWGTTQHRLLLTTRNEAEFLSGIPVSRLAKTFRHAISVTLQLNFRYLWIDSLCILQDSAQDWQSQSAEMGRIYQGACFNIGTLDAFDDDEGMLPVQDLRVSRGFEYCGRNDHSGSALTNVYNCSWTTRSDKPVLHKLLSRAWVFQERILAHQALLFDDLGISWSCFSRRHLYWWAGENGWFDWADLVEEYTFTQVTYPKDRLIALSAVADRWSSIIDSKYFAGLFETELFEQLTWTVLPGYRSSPIVQYLAPSWSWASVNRPVKFLPRPRVYIAMARCIDVYIKLVDEAAPFGQVSKGKVTLACEPLHVRSVRTSSRNHYIELDINEPSCIARQEVSEYRSIPFEPDCILDLDALRFPMKKKLSVIPVAMAWADGFTLRCNCLVVESITNTNAYKRIGTAAFSAFRDHEPGILENQFDLWQILIKPSTSKHDLTGKISWWETVTPFDENYKKYIRDRVRLYSTVITLV